MEPGGSGDIYEGLNVEEREALEEATRMGFPKKAWFAHEYIGNGALPVLAPAIGQMNPGYYEDFWKLPGYLGSYLIVRLYAQEYNLKQQLNRFRFLKVKTKKTKAKQVLMMHGTDC